ncbi:hypothetical protein D3C72_2409020 [compost metagenome]
MSAAMLLSKATTHRPMKARTMPLLMPSSLCRPWLTVASKAVTARPPMMPRTIEENTTRR